MTFNKEKFKRIELMIGTEGMKRLESCSIAVLGLGAVGSHVVEALARSGVGKLTLVDFDSVGLSNFNRQLFAVESTLGQLKIHVAKERIRQINPEMTVLTHNRFCHLDTFDEIFSDPFDVVVDAMDSLNPKVNVLYELAQRGFSVVSSMGAARKVDPGAIRTGDISETFGCPLARSVRKRLKRMGVQTGIQCVYSTEIVSRDTVSDELEPNVQNAGRLRNPMGSLIMITGIFGYTAALEALKKVLGPILPTAGT